MFDFLKKLFGSGGSENLRPLIENGAYLVDVRTPFEFSGGSVKGAVNIPLDKVQNNLAKFKNKNQIIVFCRSGNRSGQAKSILAQNGITNVTNGGTWQNVNQYVTNKNK
ncbi:MAG: rhodanese-like domain-containing protein [Saprospiraceae bacterium]|jgi:phage shock protein E|nr:rhodanese-like domain-containing protein [Saprospiraceae bacterium]MBL0294758.1 rhodanese-like domain-containing protein [Saprospiraceae bacterium]